MLPLSFVGAPLEMTKRRSRESMQVLYENHIDPRKDEELKQSKIEIENKLPKILKLVKERRQNKRNKNIDGNLRKESELIELIEDFHKQYQFIYDLYDHLRGQLSQTVNGSKEDEGYFTATSSSDSESENDVSSDVTHLNNGFQNHQLMEKLTHLAQDREPLNFEYMETANKVQESEKMEQNLDEECKELREKLSSLGRMYKDLIKELESEISSLNLKLDSVCVEKRVLGEIVENKNLQEHVSNLENIVNEVEGVENGSVYEISKIKGLITQVENLKLNVNSLSTQKDDYESINGSSLHENLSDQVNKMKHDLGLMRKKNTELESILKKKGQENSDILSQIESLKKDLEGKNLDLKKTQKEKENSLMKVKSLEFEKSENEKQIEKRLEVDRGDEFSDLQNEMSNQIVALTREVSRLQRETNMKRKLDEQISYHDKEISQLGEESESLQAKILELEIVLTEKEDNIVGLERRIQVLSSQISYLQRELIIEKEKSQERSTQMETQNNELISNVSDQQVILKQQEDTLNKLREDCKLVKGRFLQAADRKMDEVGEEFRKKFEDKLRILSQRVRVAEQLHAENKDSYKRLKDRCEKQHPGLERKLYELMSFSKKELCKVSEVVNEMMKGMENVVSNLESKERGFVSRVSKVSDEIKVVKNWVRWTMDEMNNNKHWIKNEVAVLGDDREEGNKVMKEKVKRLEAKVNKENSDKLRLMRGTYELQKKVAELENVVVEKDEGLLRLGEEKVEAIRHLCIWIDYHQSRFDHLRKMLLVKRIKSRGRP